MQQVSVMELLFVAAAMSVMALIFFVCAFAIVNWFIERIYIERRASELKTIEISPIFVNQASSSRNSDIKIEIKSKSKSPEVCGYRILLSRHASWVLHNVLGAKRELLSDAFDEYLNNRPDSSTTAEFIYLTRRYIDGVIRYVFAIDEKTTDSQANIMVFAVQPDVSPLTAGPGLRANCHLTTEMYQTKTHSLISTSIEFALAARPAKRINLIQSWGSPEWRIVSDDSVEEYASALITRVKHLVSASYGVSGLILLDFALSVRHHPPTHNEYPADEWYSSRDEYLADLRNTLYHPMSYIEQEILADSKRGLAPTGIHDLAPFFDAVCEQTANSVITNLSIFSEELDSGINPHLRNHKYINKVFVPN